MTVANLFKSFELKLKDVLEFTSSRSWVALGSLYAIFFAHKMLIVAEQIKIPLRNDARRFLEITEAMTHPYETRHREFVWIWLVKIWTWPFDNPVLALRVLSAIPSAAVPILSGYVAYLVTRRSWVFALVTLSMGTTTRLTYMFGGGLREDFYTCALLLVAVCYYKVRESKSNIAFWSWASAGIFFFAQGIRTNSLVFIFPFLAWIFWSEKRRLVPLVLALALWLVLYIPSALYQKATYGDPFHVLNSHTLFFRNMELKNIESSRRTQTEARAEEFRTTYRIEEKMGSYEYFIGLRGLREFLNGCRRGFEKIWLRTGAGGYLNRFLPWDLDWLVIPMLVGLVALLYQKHFWLALLYFSSVNVFYFLASIRIDTRLVSHISPFVHLCVFWGFAQVFRLASELGLKLKRRSY